MKGMQLTYQIELSLSGCSSIPAISPAIWKGKRKQGMTTTAKDRSTREVKLNIDIFKLHSSKSCLVPKLALYKPMKTKWQDKSVVSVQLIPAPDVEIKIDWQMSYFAWSNGLASIWPATVCLCFSDNQSSPHLVKGKDCRLNVLQDIVLPCHTSLSPWAQPLGCL